LIFLDTHVAVWLFENNLKPFTPTGLQLVKENELRISPMAILELSYLFEIKRIRHSAEQICDALTRDVGLKIDETPFAQVVETACTLTWTRDPFDRLIVAQAMRNDAPLLTKDETLRNGYKGGIW